MGLNRALGHEDIHEGSEMEKSERHCQSTGTDVE